MEHLLSNKEQERLTKTAKKYQNVKEFIDAYNSVENNLCEARHFYHNPYNHYFGEDNFDDNNPVDMLFDAVIKMEDFTGIYCSRKKQIRHPLYLSGWESAHKITRTIDNANQVVEQYMTTIASKLNISRFAPTGFARIKRENTNWSPKRKNKIEECSRKGLTDFFRYIHEK